VGLAGIVERAFRSPFFRAKLDAAGVRPGDPLDWHAWRRIPPTTKDELRAISDSQEDLWIVRREDVAEFWRSGGVTGRPLFYPRTAKDVEDSLAAFRRSLEFAGVGAADTFMCSLPIGIHPAGQQMVRAAESIGAAVVWAGAGNQTPSSAQIELVHELGVTVWCGMPSFGLQLAHLAEAAGRPFSRAAVRTLLTTAEMMWPAKRTLLSRLWGARIVDSFGMSELTLMGAECGRRPGLHVWTEHSFCEVLDPDTLQPVRDGDVGVLCATQVSGATAVPFLRWLSGDVVRMDRGCECPAAAHPRLIHSGRTASFFKVKGVNVNHNEVEDALYAVPGILDFRVTLTSDERLAVDLECVEAEADRVRRAVGALFVDRFGLRADVTLVERGVIASAVEGQLKAQRFVDARG
jgi:phenylacetate-CoA ligase